MEILLAKRVSIMDTPSHRRTKKRKPICGKMEVLMTAFFHGPTPKGFFDGMRGKRRRYDDCEYTFVDDDFYVEVAGGFMWKADLHVKIDVKDGYAAPIEFTLHCEHEPWTSHYLQPEERFREPSLAHVLESMISRHIDETEQTWERFALEYAEAC